VHFTSWPFAAFLAVVVVAAWSLGRRRNAFLLAASVFFFGYSDWRFLPLLAATVAAVYTLGIALDRAASVAWRRALLGASVALSLAPLLWLKYTGFFLATFTALLGGDGGAALAGLLPVALPLGISFYTFKAVSYAVDVYRRQCDACRSVLDLALYVTFFPHLAAGPIERAGGLLQQLAAPAPRRPTTTRVRAGVTLVCWGLMKKVAIADNLALIVDATFARPAGDAPGPEVLIALYAFAWQIYCDFSGYTDIARGVAALLGIDSSLNFRLPYLAAGPVDFWRRWHVTLSTWLRDYVFLPVAYPLSRAAARLGLAPRREDLVTYAAATAATMLACGLWHGAGWTFVAWGLYHALLLVGERALGRRPRPRRAGLALVGRLAGVVGTFHLVCLGWLLFRASTIAQAADLLGALATDYRWTYAAGAHAAFLLRLVLPVAAVEAVAAFRDDPRLVERLPGWLATAVCLLSLLLAGVYALQDARPFIYGRF
jgi:D-alanyl-lipoteichoic acid acyltransferase DltB (MBOAT superfamily)